MAYSPHPDFQTLYSIYTGDPEGIGPHLNTDLARAWRNDPLLVATGTDLVLFPGDGTAPLVESFRKSTRGFTELTAVSHLGVAAPYLIRMKELGDARWRTDAERLIEQAERVRQINTLAYWRDVVAVEAWRGLEGKIVDMVDYSCAVTADYLRRGLADPSILTFQHVRDHFLDTAGPDDIPVPMNDMMAATFSLVSLDNAYRIIRWLRAQAFDWSRLMVMISGRAGRATAGLTWQTNSMCHMLWRASGEQLPPERLLIAPHAPALALSDLDDPARRGGIEAQFREIWFSCRASAELGGLMYEHYPAFRPMIGEGAMVDAATRSISEMPHVRSADDRLAIVTRLRLVMEDPAQQLANASAQFIVDQLCEAGNRPEAVVIPGFTNTVYPRGPATGAG